ncbi:30S ribosomal protein THX [Roseivirga sp. BDSF3-8]
MGRGDKKTKKGKISMGSYGVRRPRKANKKSSGNQEEKTD